MRSAAMRATLALISLTLAATMVAAQAPPPAASPSPVSPDVVTNRIDQEIAPAPGSYAYTAQGRRDPFVSLLKPVSESGPGKSRPGMECILLQEVALQGLGSDAKGSTPTPLGPPAKAYDRT